jgi:hypothetical protein
MDNKIYLRIRKNVMILLDDGFWTLTLGDMIVFQKIGQKLKEVRHSNNNIKYIKEDCYLTTSIEYSTIKNLREVVVEKKDIEYYMVSKEINIIDTLIKISENQYSYSISYTYSELIDRLERQDIELTSFFNSAFENVTLLYNRDDKINKILN